MSRVVSIALFVCAGITACGGDTEIDLLPKAASQEAGVGGSSAGTGGSGGIACGAACGGEAPYCDSSSGRCVRCLVAAHCTPPKACDPSGNCADPCTGAGQECTSGSKPVCDPGTGACVECITAQDCHDEPICTQGRCGECRGNADCAAKGPENPYCALATHQCRECLVNGDCTPPQTCDPQELQCKG